MLRTMDEAYKIQQLQAERLNPLESFWWMTRGNAEALSLQNHIGGIAPGMDADLVVMDMRATPRHGAEAEVVSTLAEGSSCSRQWATTAPLPRLCRWKASEIGTGWIIVNSGP